MATVANLGIGGLPDRPYGSVNRVIATFAAATIPQYAGEIILALDTGLRFRALGPTAGAGWGQVTDRMN